jgi:hypothetical protein
MVVPSHRAVAENVTGEPTVDPAVGEQMFTLGVVEPALHPLGGGGVGGGGRGGVGVPEPTVNVCFATITFPALFHVFT